MDPWGGPHWSEQLIPKVGEHLIKYQEGFELLDHQLTWYYTHRKENSVRLTLILTPQVQVLPRVFTLDTSDKLNTVLSKQITDYLDDGFLTILSA